MQFSPPGRISILASLFCLGSILAGCDDSGTADPAIAALPGTSVTTAAAVTPAEFIGSAECARCHPAQTAAWKGSDHDRAMERPTQDSVLGRFDGATFQRGAETWTFSRSEGRFVVTLSETGRDPLEMPVAYTFGVDPLQQYLVARDAGRMQALPIAWDDRSKEAGGQRWIDLQRGETITRDDPLHWERLAYNWNSQCASCHSTDLAKGYDAETGRFASTWSDIDVGCEACHGKGSRHRALYEGETRPGGESGTGFDVRFEAWNPDAWQRAEGMPIASRTLPRSHDAQIDVCAPCHSRRSQIVETPVVGASLLDGHRPALLTPGLYFEDGQIQDEVYVWGSFLQSRMHTAGVRCNDCHEPHSLGLRREGNALCSGCHAPGVYDAKSHHGHSDASAGARCVSCHMPERTYMEVDARRDHAFPIPRPDRSQSLGVPNACETCHGDRDAGWAMARIESWRGPDAERPAHWSDLLVEGDVARRDPARWVEIALDMSHAPIVRANAWARYAEEIDESTGGPPTDLLADRIATGTDLERLALVEVARRLPPPTRASLLRPLLEDERLAIRVAAAEALANLPADLWRPADRAVLARALREHRAQLLANAERPESQVGLGLLAANYGEADAARAAYERAIELAPYFVPAYANLADLERALGRNAEAVALLRQAVALAPDESMVRHALGLALYRSGELEEGVEQLGQAAQAAPDAPRLVLGWALALDAAGRRGEAIEVLSALTDRGISSGEVQHALVTLLRDAGQTEAASQRAQAWLQSSPNDPRARALFQELVIGR